MNCKTDISTCLQADHRRTNAKICGVKSALKLPGTQRKPRVYTLQQNLHYDDNAEEQSEIFHLGVFVVFLVFWHVFLLFCGWQLFCLVPIIQHIVLCGNLGIIAPSGHSKQPLFHRFSTEVTDLSNSCCLVSSVRPSQPSTLHFLTFRQNDAVHGWLCDDTTTKSRQFLCRVSVPTCRAFFSYLAKSRKQSTQNKPCVLHS